MRKSERFKPKKNYAVFCLVGQGSGAEVSELMSRAVLLCRKEKIAKPLMDSTSLPGFQPPGISERYKLAERIASGAASLVKPAHGANQKWFRSGKCAVTVAKNRGLDAENFHAAATAVERRMKSK